MANQNPDNKLSDDEIRVIITGFHANFNQVYNRLIIKDIIGVILSFIGIIMR